MNMLTRDKQYRFLTGQTLGLLITYNHKQHDITQSVALLNVAIYLNRPRVVIMNVVVPQLPVL